MATQYEGTGKSLEAAMEAAQMKIPPSAGRDYTVSKVIDWGLQYGGFIPAKLYYVIVEEDPDAPFRTKSAGPGA